MQLRETPIDAITTLSLVPAAPRRRLRAAISDLDLQALADGELESQVAEELQARLLHDSVARRRYRDLLEQKRLLMMWWRQFS